MAQILIFTGSTKNWLEKPGSNLARPLGAYQIASILRNNGYTVQVIDYWYHLIEQSEKFVEIFKKHVGPETIWIGWSNTFLTTGKLNSEGVVDHGADREMLDSIGLTERGYGFIQRYAKEQNPNIKFICGGAKAFSWSNQTTKFFDYFIAGYADVTALHLTEYLIGKRSDLKTFKNFNGSETIMYDTKGALFDFNHHVHVWHKSDHLPQEVALPIEISRGCIFKCAYCSFPLNGKKKNDFIRDPGLIIDELTYNYETFGTTHYMYSDDTHNDSVEKLEYLYNNVYSKLSFKISFSTYLRLDLLAAHPQTIPLLKDSGLVGTFFGIESFNKESNKVIGKTATKERIMENLWKCKESWKDDVIMQAGLIVGLPNDTPETCREWLRESLQKDSPLDSATIAPLQILPKGYYSSAQFQSPIDLEPEKFGYTFNESNIWTNNKGMNKYEAMRIKDEADNWQHRQKPLQKNWYDPQRAVSLGITLDEYYQKSIFELKEIEENKLKDYFNDLLH
jgi:radical SAM superfamily enzyme YgiQ (UPF0313 family)